MAIPCIDRGELEYSKQVEYLKACYPYKKFKIKDGGVFELEALANKSDLHGLIKRNSIKCTSCRKRIFNEWIVIFYNPRWYDKPIEVLFFCDRDCAIKWNNNCSAGLIY